MAKRRNRIVHDADLLHGESDDWSIVGDWQLIMWLLAVPTFYYQLRISLDAANAIERAMHDRLRAAMASHVAFGKQLLAVPDASPEQQQEAFKEIVVTINSIVSTLYIDPRALATNGG